MENKVSFKAVLKQQGTEDEVRRFIVNEDESKSLSFMREKLGKIYQQLNGKRNVSIHWLDSEGDKITIKDDDELITALKEMCGPVYKLIVDFEVKYSNDHGENAATHHGIVCDCCETTPIRGNRYKCVVCNDFDLCNSCESSGLHAEHPVLRISSPKSASSCGLTIRPWQFLPWPLPATRSNEEKSKSRNHKGKISVENENKKNSDVEDVIIELETNSDGKELEKSQDLKSSCMEVEVNDKSIEDSKDTEMLSSEDEYVIIDNKDKDESCHNNSIRVEEKTQLYPTLIENVGDSLVEQQAVSHHPDPKIQAAIQLMRNIGFSNEGEWLTRLLESKRKEIK